MIHEDSPFIDIHTHRQAGPFTSYGVHPWWFDDPAYHADNDLSLLEQLLRKHKLAAIGETGIDKLHPETLALQTESFEKHIALSESYQKPLIIHNVKGNETLLQLVKKHKPQQAWIIHGFNGNDNEVRQLVSQGLYLSVGSSLLYENRKITKAIKSIPLDHLFFETDTAENSIEEIYQKAATVLNMPLAQLKERIFANFKRLILDFVKQEHGITESVVDAAVLHISDGLRERQGEMAFPF